MGRAFRKVAFGRSTDDRDYALPVERIAINLLAGKPIREAADIPRVKPPKSTRRRTAPGRKMPAYDKVAGWAKRCETCGAILAGDRCKLCEAKPRKRREP